MQTTLEIRWFMVGMPPAVVRRWFNLECPGKFQEPEIREDIYFYGQFENLSKLQAIYPRHLAREKLNLKLRQGNVELKVQLEEISTAALNKVEPQQLGTRQFKNSDRGVVWEGNIEQWYKLSESELIEQNLLLTNDLPRNHWIPVLKEREQRIDRDVKSELTLLKVNNYLWWSIAFEMPQTKGDRRQLGFFEQAIANASQTYSGPKLLADNSYSYTYWLLNYVAPYLNVRNQKTPVR